MRLRLGRLLHSVAMVFCVCLFTGITSAYDDPFGSDPFGGSRAQPSADPFGGRPARVADDPFGGAPAQAAEDPFGGKPGRAAGNPFGDGDANGPFGGGAANTQKRARTTARPVPGIKDAAVVMARPVCETEAMIRSELKSKTSVSAVEMPLSEFIKFLSEKHDLPIVIDRVSLEEIGLTEDTPINFNLSGVSLRSTLRLALRPFDLTYQIKDEVLQVMTLQAAELNLTVRAFGIPELLVDRTDELIKVVQGTVCAETWDVIGGPSHLAVVGNVMVVSSVEFVHEDVAALMEKIEAAAANRQK